MATNDRKTISCYSGDWAYTTVVRRPRRRCRVCSSTLHLAVELRSPPNSVQKVTIMYRQRIGLRAEYRDQEGERVKASPSLANKFQKLKSLKVKLGYYNPKGVAQNGQLKYDVNLENAKSVFRFRCPNDECIRVDFDLTKE